MNMLAAKASFSKIMKFCGGITAFAAALLIVFGAFVQGQNFNLGAATAVALQPPGPNAQGCYNPVDYGATPNNESDDDRPGGQAAIDAAAAAGGGRVCWPAGRFRLTRAPARSR